MKKEERRDKAARANFDCGGSRARWTKNYIPLESANNNKIDCNNLHSLHLFILAVTGDFFT
jgi:hypothetical protein